MAFIRTNLQAGLISRQLAGINRQFTTNLERLSTGVRLNRPDDSPGQFGVVVSQNLQISALGQGIINAQNAAGMLQTAEEGIGTVIDLLNRAHDLAVTAADSTLTQSQREQAQDEITELLTKTKDSEIDLILKNVKFNGIQLLSDSNQAAAIENSTLGVAGGNHGVDKTVEGGTYITAGLGDDITTGSTAAFSTNSLKNAGTRHSFATAGVDADFRIEGGTLATGNTHALMEIRLDNFLARNFQIGDFIELKITDTDAAGNTVNVFTDLATVVNIDSTPRHPSFITVTNARAPGSALSSAAFVETATGNAGGQFGGTDTIEIRRVAQTLIADSTGATITTSGQSTKTWDFRDVEEAVEIRNTLRIGVVLNPTSDEGRDRAILETVLISFTETDPIKAAAQIQGAIEEQLGGEYRAGGDLHIDVRAVALVTKSNAADANANNGDAILGREVELTDTLFTTSMNHFGPTDAATFVNLAGGNLELSEDVADIQHVRFKFTTTTTAGVNETPQIRAISDELAGYEGAGKLFENLTVATGEHGNDKFLINIDGETVEADLDVAAATNGANSIIDKIVGVEEAARDTADSESGMRLSRIGFNVSAAGVVSNSTTAASATGKSGAASVTANNQTYLVDPDGGAADYFDPEAIRLLLLNGINNQSNFAKDVGVAYDSVTRTFTTTTGSRGNTSSLSIGRSAAANRESTLMPTITDLVNSTGGSGIKGALGFNKDAFSNGSGSIFEFRLGGESDTYSITIDTLGAANFGADLTDISNVNVGTQGGAAAAISLLSDALESVSTTQTKIGAGINHMQRRINVLETHREALSGQRARIQEIDFTQETRTLASLQILLQSSTAALAQANIIPQTLLQLLA